MGPVVRMKTGFFETTPYRLKAGEAGLLLVPMGAGDAKRIVLAEQDILAVTLTERRLPELEIQTRDALYTGVLEPGYPFADAVRYLKGRLHAKIICEYLGGEKNDDA